MGLLSIPVGEKYLTPDELCARWKGATALGTLANWRSLGVGPIWTKLRGRVLYALVDVETWESQQRHGSTREAGQ